MLSRLRRVAAPVLAIALVASLAPATLALVPIAADDAATVAEDADPTTIDVLDNDSSAIPPDDNRIVSASDPANGTVVIAGDERSLAYEPDADFHGQDVFGYTITDATGIAFATAVVTMTVTSVNDPPVALDDPSLDCATPQFGGSLLVIEDWGQPFPFGGTCGPLHNDSDVEDDELEWTIASQAAHGTVVVMNQGFGGYSPDPDYSTKPGDLPGGTWVSDSFTYRADDGPAESNEATYRIWVAPINDPPTFTPGGNVTVDEDSGAYSAGWATDVSPGPANEADQAVTFELGPVSGEVLGPGPLFATLPAIDAAGTLTFSLTADASGYADVTFRAVDDGGLEDYGAIGPFDPPDDTSDDVTFRITVDPINDEPDAVNDFLIVDEDAGPTPINVRANDTSAPDVGESLTISAKTNGAKGTVAITGGGTGLTYQPTADLNGSDTFTYTVSDGNGGSDTATVGVTITPVNDLPVATDDGSPVRLVIGQGAGPTQLLVLANDHDGPDSGETLKIGSVSDPAHGATAIRADKLALTYDPDGAFVGLDSFTYAISDGHGGTASATVYVEVVADVTPPTISHLRTLVVGAIGGARARLGAVWAGTDSQSGVASYQLQLSTDGGAWVNVALAGPSATRATIDVPAGHAYRLRVRAKDGNDNVGTFTTSAVLAV